MIGIDTLSLMMVASDFIVEEKSDLDWVRECLKNAGWLNADGGNLFVRATHGGLEVIVLKLAASQVSA